jgi:hypothetical protein
MLDDVIVGFLDSVTEREFDAPFMSILVGESYSDIHFLHGPSEFGKDFIAKKTCEGVTFQYAFQSKVGNLGLSDWRGVRAQIDELRRNSLAHPAFDTSLPRTAVLVTTGRLVGQAAIEAQDFAKSLALAGEQPFEVWDQPKLCSLLRSNLQASLAGAMSSEFLRIVADAQASRVRDSEIGVYSRHWAASSSLQGLFHAAIEAAILATELRAKLRPDLAAFVALCLTRGIWSYGQRVGSHGGILLQVAAAANSMFQEHAGVILQSLIAGGVGTDSLLESDAHGSIVAYPIRCARLCETIGLLGLLPTKAASDANSIANVLSSLIEGNVGCSHPVSDRWAVSFAPAVLLLARYSKLPVARKLLTDITKWLCDRYEAPNKGLASYAAEPDEEVRRFLLGAESDDSTRHASTIASTVLDLCAVLREGDLYETLLNEILAVGISPWVVEVGDESSQYFITGHGVSIEPNMLYSESWSPEEGWKVAGHHRRLASSRFLLRLDRPWDQLAISSVLRDRNFIDAWIALLAPSSDARPDHTSDGV